MHFTTLSSTIQIISTMDEHEMVDPETAPWNLSISDADFEKLKAGFASQSMDDKWTVTVADPDDRGIISITVTRAGTGRKHYTLHIKLRDRASGVKVESFTWEQNQGGVYISEDQGKINAVILLRGILDCEFGKLPDYDSSLMWTHPTFKLGLDYNEEKNKALARKKSSGSR
jgi:hypothetical protein